MDGPCLKPRHVSPPSPQYFPKYMDGPCLKPSMSLTPPLPLICGQPLPDVESKDVPLHHFLTAGCPSPLYCQHQSVQLCLVCTIQSPDSTIHSVLSSLQTVQCSTFCTPFCTGFEPRPFCPSPGPVSAFFFKWADIVWYSLHLVSLVKTSASIELFQNNYLEVLWLNSILFNLASTLQSRFVYSSLPSLQTVQAQVCLTTFNSWLWSPAPPLPLPPWTCLTNPGLCPTFSPGLYLSLGLQHISTQPPAITYLHT